MKFLITESQFERLQENQKYVDSLLDKISEKGYESLSIDEKRYLDEFSKHEGDPDEFVDPLDRYDEREGESFEGEVDGKPIQYTFSEESYNQYGIGLYGEIKYDDDEYLGVIIVNKNGTVEDFDFYSVISDEDVRLQNKLDDKSQYELLLFFEEEVVPFLVK